MADQSKPPSNSDAEAEGVVVAKVLYDLGREFELHVEKEVIIRWRTSPMSTSSRRTTVISGHNYTCRVMNNGFVELGNEVGTILIPMENVVSIVRKK